MPDAIRITVEGFGARPPKAHLCASSTRYAKARLRASVAREDGRKTPLGRYTGFRAAGAAIAAVLGCPVAPTAAHAEDAPVRDGASVDAYVAALLQLDRHELVALALTLGILCFAVVTAIMLVRTRQRLGDTEAAARDESIVARGVGRPRLCAAAVRAAGPRCLGGGVRRPRDHRRSQPDHRPRYAPSGARLRHLARARQSARHGALGRCVARPRRSASRRRSPPCRTASSKPKAQLIGGRAVLRLREVSGIKHELAELSARHQKHVDDTAALRRPDRGAALADLDARRRRQAGVRQFGLCARGGGQGRGRGGGTRARAARPRRARPSCCARTRRENRYRRPAAGGGRPAAVEPSTSSPCRPRTAAPASASTRPRSDLLRAELKRMVEAHRRTLDQLTTGVAIFGANQKLSFYNAAYRSLWDLDAGFLDQGPTDSAVLDQLRAARKLPERAGFPAMARRQLHEAYRAIEPKSRRCGICRSGAPCASSPRPTPKAA